jgi:WD40 repeat protein/predicted Ser/Thr protein kinase
VTPEDFERVRELFLLVRDTAPEQRGEMLDRECANRSDLRAEVEALLAHDHTPHELLGIPSCHTRQVSAYQGLSAEDDAPALPSRIGRYTILDRLGEGGMGIVYLAEQDRPRRKVALKVMRPGMLSPAVQRRFKHETSILGQLEHPGIARIYEAGVAELHGEAGVTASCPFFAMEYIQGQPLDVFIRRQQSGVPDCFALVADVCDAVHYAHQKGIVHRDLKPANILVEPNGQPKVLDFGVARMSGTDAYTITAQTEPGQLVGTIPYMSPEQVSGSPVRVDVRSDVYSIGVILYELLAGRVPHDVSHMTIPQAIRSIEEFEPTRLGSIQKSLRGDVETIVAKALEKEPSRRYQTASDLAADLRRYLADQPITARPPTTFYQLRKFTKRNRPLVFGTLATILALLIAVVGITIQAVRATRERNRAQLAEQLAEQRFDEAELRAYAAHIAAAQAALRANDVAVARQRLQAAPPHLRNWEWRYLASRLDASLAKLESHEHHVWSVAYTPDGSLLASGSADGTVKLWDATDGCLTRTLSADGGCVRSVAFSPDGRRLLAATENGLLWLWSSPDGDPLMTLSGHTRGVMDVAFSPDGALIASVSYDRTARIWNADTGELVTVLQHPHWLHDLAFSPDSTRLATACRDNVARLWDLSGRAPVVEIRVHPATADWDFIHSWAVALSPDGEIIATGAHDGVIKLWSASSGDLTKVLAGHTGRVRSLAFSPDGAWLASASDDRTVRIWNATAGLELCTLLGHEIGVFGITFAPDGTRLASASADRTIRIWDARGSLQESHIHGHGNQGIPAIDVSPDGTRIISGGEDAVVCLWDVSSNAEVAAMRGHDDSVYAVAFSPDGARAASGSRDGEVRLWDVATGKGLGTLNGHEGAVRKVVFLPDSARLASASEDGTLRLWDTASLSEITTLRSDTEQFLALACSAEGRQLASGSSTGRIECWDVQTAGRLNTLEAHKGRIWHLAYSPDGALLVSTSGDRTLKLWSADTFELMKTLQGHTNEVSAATFSNDGTRIASVSFDRTLRLWDPLTYETVLSFDAHQDWPWAVTFSPDDQWLVSSGVSIRIWRATEPTH